MIGVPPPVLIGVGTAGAGVAAWLLRQTLAEAQGKGSVYEGAMTGMSVAVLAYALVALAVGAGYLFTGMPVVVVVIGFVLLGLFTSIVYLPLGALAGIVSVVLTAQSPSPTPP
ncbi:hypothetical protein [Rubrivirga sp. IMCC43871]|uniref:hypothetical protein n=1 Tax=Rubrivirga sp. IMCC43871 TaxID=3391575 RepID=UPI0039900805